ncbi:MULTISPECIES: IS110 family transposase [Geobacillus]|uniref:IS110 family transposase n=1 Tax=Geobacillus TaxID=129337 RepID=UPI002AC94FE6|nr:IS110 family transposase [Geobacillus subterraneus]WPZ16904.1 IS110 family transposase [Geobacillus subterraneus]
MNCTQNHKIDQVTDETLVVGMDIAKRKHYACFVDARGRVLQKSFPVIQSKQGFEQLDQRIRQAMNEFGKTKVIVAIEPTGHYWLNLAYFLEEKGIPLVMVNPAHVRRSKELDDNLPTKHDAKDALVIARLAKDGRFSFPRLLRDIEADLRVGSTLREKFMKEHTAVRNAMIRWTDRYFPEFSAVFSSLGKMALAVLELTPFPEEITGRTVEELVKIYRQSEGLKAPQKPKIRKLLEVASHSIGVTEGQQMARFEIAALVRRYRQLEEEIAALDAELTALAQTTVEYQWLKTVDGLGDATIVDLLAEIGSFAHYRDPRQLIKLAGLTLKENSSGQHKGQKRISKRGRKRLRSVLFRTMIPLIRHNEAFRELHNYYTTRAVNPLSKKQSIVVLCGKLLKVLFTICTKKQAFDGERMRQDVFAHVQVRAA